MYQLQVKTMFYLLWTRSISCSYTINTNYHHIYLFLHQSYNLHECDTSCHPSLLDSTLSNKRQKMSQKSFLKLTIWLQISGAALLSWLVSVPGQWVGSLFSLCVWIPSWLWSIHSVKPHQRNRSEVRGRVHVQSGGQDGGGSVCERQHTRLSGS